MDKTFLEWEPVFITGNSRHYSPDPTGHNALIIGISPDSGDYIVEYNVDGKSYQIALTEEDIDYAYRHTED